MAGYRLSAAAQADLINILAWIHERFGESARERYEALVVAALRDIAAQPDRAGSIERPELGEGVRSWHLRLSRERARLAVCRTFLCVGAQAFGAIIASQSIDIMKI
ncbi:MAG: type II toxin-antitoxin system RelE/ParE family toxin [Gammaproteobacteria bacterium]|nr:type II toxin-antitoxin system RelE/ParE family toxin [Gammaproteobacteria bacterium]